MNHNWWIYVIVFVAAFIFSWVTLRFVAYLQARKKDKKEKKGPEVGKDETEREKKDGEDKEEPEVGKDIAKGATFRLGSVLAAIGIGVEVLGIFVGLEIIAPREKWKLEGTVIDDVIHRPIPEAQVIVTEFSAFTDRYGRYSIRYDGVARPEWRVRVTKAGYSTLERTLTSGKDTTIFLGTPDH
jgi:hypothetical protein